MNRIFDAILLYQELLAQIAGPRFEIVDKYSGNQLPYRWEIRTVTEPIQNVTTVALHKNEILCMNGKRKDEMLEYLRGRFGHLLSI